MSTDVAVNPATGEVLDRLDEQPAETLAEALHVVHERQADLKTWAAALEAELRARLKVRQAKLAVFGDWEVELAVTRKSEWDADELERVMQELVDDGVVRAADLTGIIDRQPVVARSKAKAFAGRLDGEARTKVLATCTWKDDRAKITVARSVALTLAEPPDDPSVDSALETPHAPSRALQAPQSDLDPEELFA